MTIKRLKKMIENLPDNMRIYADDGDHGMFSNNNEFVAVVHNDKNMCVMQTKKDFDVNEEVTSWYNNAKDNRVDSNTFWKEFYETGYDYDDFEDEELQKEGFIYFMES